MIVDTSVVIALIMGEAEADCFATQIHNAGGAKLSAVSYVEAALVLTGRSREDALDSLLQEFTITLEPVTIEQAKLARDAGRRFGKGHHRAGLNFGDCFAYALAKASGEPLLFKGDDFGHTDVAGAGA